MKQKIIEMLLTLAMVFSIAATALAEEEGAASSAVSDAAEAGNISWMDTMDEKTQKLLEEATLSPEKLKTIEYAGIEQQMRNNNLSVLALQESVDMLKSIDYEELQEELRDQLNEIANLQWGIIQAGSIDPDDPIMGDYYVEFDSFAYAQTQQLYDGLREQFDAMKDGEMQEDNADVIRQLNDLQNQIVMGGEMLYVTLAGLEIQEAALQRQLASMNRTVEEMELRHQMGQISALQLSQTKAGQTALASGIETLRMNIRNYKAQFQMMLGGETNGELRLGGVPEVTEKQLDAMDVEKDLLKAKSGSYTLYSAARTLEDEREAYEEAVDDYGRHEEKLGFRKAKHTWQAAQYTYNSTVREYELKLRTLYAQVLDYKQIREAAKVALESEQSSFAASELKYQQGTISKNAYLAAQDKLKAAEETVQTAANDLFASYNTYCWAVQNGILN